MKRTKANEALQEDLADLAAYQFAVAQQLCIACDNYHALWGYERLAGLKANSFETERDLLKLVFSANLPGNGELLIAGVADAGLLALTAQITRDRLPRITVADRCAAPLAVCARYADACALSISTMHVDLTASPPPANYDLVFAHNTLMLQPPNLHVAFLRNIGKSLNGSGAFVLVHRVRSVKPDRLPSAHYASRILQALSSRGIPLPEQEGEFRKRLESYTEKQHAWSDALLDLSHVESAFAEAGFRVERRIDHERRRTVPDRDGGPPTPMTTHIFIARPKL